MKLIIITIFIAMIAGAISLVWMQDEHGCPSDDRRDSCILKIIDEEGKLAPLDICEEIHSIDKKNLCYFNLAKYNHTESFKACSKITNINNNPYSKDNCFFNLALKLGKEDYCYKISTDNQKKICIKSFNIDLK